MIRVIGTPLFCQMFFLPSYSLLTMIIRSITQSLLGCYSRHTASDFQLHDRLALLLLTSLLRQLHGQSTILKKLQRFGIYQEEKGYYSGENVCSCARSHLYVHCFAYVSPCPFLCVCIFYRSKIQVRSKIYRISTIHYLKIATVLASNKFQTKGNLRNLGFFQSVQSRKKCTQIILFCQETTQSYLNRTFCILIRAL